VNFHLPAWNNRNPNVLRGLVAGIDILLQRPMGEELEVSQVIGDYEEVESALNSDLAGSEDLRPPV
jgi:hypothetical protein